MRFNYIISANNETTNAALGKPNSISSMYKDDNGSLALDGAYKTSGWDNPPTCMHTSIVIPEHHPYLLVDLVDIFMVFKIKIYNRVDTKSK